MARHDDFPVFEYAVDAKDVLTSVSEPWLAFARDNEAPELTRESVIGRPIWDFVVDQQTRFLCHLLFERAREAGSVRRIPFRCDPPECRRFMELDLTPLANGGVELTARLIREEPRERVALLDADVPRSAETLPICSQCKRIAGPEGEWIEVEDGIRRLDLFGAGLLPRLTHVLCDACLASFENIIRIQRSEA